MQSLYVISRISIALIICVACTTESYPQIKASDPSTWPEPTLENISDTGFYTSKEKLHTYFKWKEKWREENLPNLYLRDDQYEQVRKLFLPTHSFKQAWKHDEQYISIDSLHKLDVKDYLWIKQKLEQGSQRSPCLFLQDFFYETYLVKINDSNSGASLQKMECWKSVLDDDEATQYEIERQGDTLIILKPPD